MFTFVMLLLIAYFLYTFATGIIQQIQSGAPFETVHWIMCVMCLLFIPLCVMLIRRLIKENKENKEKRAEEEIKLQQEMERRKRERYLDDEDLSFLDADTGNDELAAGEENDDTPVELNDTEKEVVASLEEEIQEIADETDDSGFSRYDN